MASRRIGQKTSLVIAYICYLGTVCTLVYAWYWSGSNNTDSPIFASLLAIIIFLLSCGVVLHFIGKADLPDLSIKSLKK